MIKLIHPKTNIVREVEESNQNKIRILKRAGFVLAKSYVAPPPPRIIAPPTVAEVVEEHQLPEGEGVVELEPELAIHMSAAARKLAEKMKLDPAVIPGSGADGQITKPDVERYLKGVK